MIAKRILKYFSYLLMTVILTLISFLVFFLMWPEIIINTENFNRIREKYLSKEMSAESLEIRVESLSFFKKQIFLRSQNFKLNFSGFNFSAQNISSGVLFSFSPEEFGLLRVKETRLENGELHLLNNSAHVDEGSSQFNFKPYFEKLKTIKIEPISIELSSLIIEKEGDPFKAKIIATLTGINLASSDALKIEISEVSGLDLSKASLSVSINNYRFPSDSQALFDWQGNAQTSMGNLEIAGRLKPVDPEGRKFDSSVIFKDEFGKLNAEIKGSIDHSHLSGELVVSAKNMTKSQVSFELQPCDVTLNWQSKKLEELDAKLRCSGVTPSARIFKKFENSRVKVASDISFSLESDIRIVPDGDQRDIYLNGFFDLHEFSFSSSKLKGKTSFDAKIPGSSSEKTVFTINSDSSLATSHFETLVADLKETPYAVPAPLNQLRGAGSCQLEGEIKIGDGLSHLPYSCKVDLKSQIQKFSLDLLGTVAVDTQREVVNVLVDLGIDIKDIWIVLPSLNLLKAPPQLMPDKRFILSSNNEIPSKANDSNTINFKYLVHIKTRRRDSIQFISDLAKQPIPLGLDLVLSSEKPMAGSITLSPFDLEVLRRVAKIENFTMSFNPDTETHPISGVIGIANNDYKIKIKIFGSLEKPGYAFESDPPLPERDLIAMVLFGKDPSDLSSDELKSSDDAKAAAAEGAVSLLSMYYLASTPVQSVAYDPYSGVFSAKISLAKGLSFTVGTDTDREARVGLRKSLGNGWSVETKAEKNEETGSSKGIALLKWGARF